MPWFFHATYDFFYSNIAKFGGHFLLRNGYFVEFLLFSLMLVLWLSLSRFWYNSTDIEAWFDEQMIK
jgi:hypothetical protein